jgi:hypothetical protein
VKKRIFAALAIALVTVIAGAPAYAGPDTLVSRPACQTYLDCSPHQSVGNQRARIGLRISPVSLYLRHKSRTAVGYGSYLVNAIGGCNDCHTSPPYANGGDPYQGQTKAINSGAYLAGGQCFGPIVSANITPDSNGLPAGLTLDEFIQTLKTGIDPREPNSILQVMPWPTYQNMTRSDLKAIYIYLTAIPSLPATNTVCP